MIVLKVHRTNSLALEFLLIANKKTGSTPICLSILPNLLTVFFLGFPGIAGLFEMVGIAKDHLINNTTLGFIQLND
jgi:hypothetical protein